MIPDEIDISVDARKYIEALRKITVTERKKVVRKALGAAASILVSEARKELGKVTNKSKSTNSNLVRNWGTVRKNGIIVGVKRMDQGINYKIHETGNFFAKVNIMGDHRLKWFEMGTADHKVNNYLGHKGVSKIVRGMKASHFFEKAKKNTEQKRLDRMQQVIDRELTKIFYGR